MVNSTEYWQFIDFTSNIVLPPDCWDNCSLQYRSAHCIQHSWTLGGSDNGYYPVPDSSVCGSSVMTSKDVDIIERYKKRFYNTKSVSESTLSSICRINLLLPFLFSL